MSTAIDNLLFRPMTQEQTKLLMFGTLIVEDNLTSTLGPAG